MYMLKYDTIHGRFKGTVSAPPQRCGGGGHAYAHRHAAARLQPCGNYIQPVTIGVV